MSTTQTKRRRALEPPTDRYMELIRAFPLRPVRTKKAYHAAGKVLDALAVRDEKALTADEADYLDVLTDLIEAYDNEHYPLPLGAPLTDRLNAIMEESGMSRADFGRLIAPEMTDSAASSLASKVLNGMRELSKTHIRRLSEHFKLEAGYFL